MQKSMATSKPGGHTLLGVGAFDTSPFIYFSPYLQELSRSQACGSGFEGSQLPVLLFLAFEVPGYGLAQAFLEVGFGLVAELLPGAIDISQRVLYVAGAGGTVVRLFLEADLCGDDFVDLVEGVAVARTDVEDAAGRDLAGGDGCEEVGDDGVVDVGEVAAGKAVAKDGG